MARYRPLPAALNRPVRLAVLISGGGTTLANLAEKIHDGTLNAQIPLVVANRADCGGLARAATWNLPCEVILRKSFASVDEFSNAIFSRCREKSIDLVICGGFLALLKIPADFQGRIMNIHPSLIPAFSGQGFHGTRVHQAALDRGAKVSGCTVHFVDDEYDHGPIIVQRTVPVMDDDSADTLAARVFQEECKALPDAIRMFASGQLEVEGSRVRTVS